MNALPSMVEDVSVNWRFLGGVMLTLRPPHPRSYQETGWLSYRHLGVGKGAGEMTHLGVDVL